MPKKKISTEHFIINLNLLELRKACQEWQSVSITALWREKIKKRTLLWETIWGECVNETKVSL